VTGGGDGGANPVAIVTNFDDSNNVGDVYKFELTSYGEGDVTVDVDANEAVDAASNPNEASNQVRTLSLPYS